MSSVSNKFNIPRIVENTNAQMSFPAFHDNVVKPLSNLVQKSTDRSLKAAKTTLDFVSYLATESKNKYTSAKNFYNDTTTKIGKAYNDYVIIPVADGKEILDKKIAQTKKALETPVAILKDRDVQLLLIGAAATAYSPSHYLGIGQTTVATSAMIHAAPYALKAADACIEFTEKKLIPAAIKTKEVVTSKNFLATMTSLTAAYFLPSYRTKILVATVLTQAAVNGSIYAANKTQEKFNRYALIKALSPYQATHAPLCNKLMENFDSKTKVLNLASQLPQGFPLQILRHFSHLESLDLNSNKLEEIPDTLFISNLKNLNLANNCLEEIPAKLSLMKLTSLDLSYNNFSYFPKAVEKMSTLKELKLAWNKIHELKIQNLKNLNLLHAQANDITNLPLDIFMPYKKMNLDLSSNPLKTIPIIAHMAGNITIPDTGEKMIAKHADAVLNVIIDPKRSNKPKADRSAPRPQGPAFHSYRRANPFFDFMNIDLNDLQQD
jgi:Leucine-rich repeat (LRR) protein